MFCRRTLIYKFLSQLQWLCLYTCISDRPCDPNNTKPNDDYRIEWNQQFEAATTEIAATAAAAAATPSSTAVGPCEPVSACCLLEYSAYIIYCSVCACVVRCVYAFTLLMVLFLARSLSLSLHLFSTLLCAFAVSLIPTLWPWMRCFHFYDCWCSHVDTVDAALAVSVSNLVATFGLFHSNKIHAYGFVTVCVTKEIDNGWIVGCSVRFCTKTISICEFGTLFSFSVFFFLFLFFCKTASLNKDGLSHWSFYT